MDFNKNVSMIFHWKKQQELSRVKQFSTLGCIHYVSYRGGGGGQRILGGDLKFLEQKKGGYENCLNISWGDAYFL